VEDPRKRLKRRETNLPRYLTFSCNRRLPLLGRPEWRDAFAESLVAARERCGFLLLAWVVMPEHVHLIVVPDAEFPVPKILFAIKQPVAKRAMHRWRETNAPILDRIRLVNGKHRYWQAGGGFDRNVRDADELWREVEYIHHNPVRRGLVSGAVDWKWSSARWYTGDRSGPVPIDPFRW